MAVGYASGILVNARAALSPFAWELSKGASASELSGLAYLLKKPNEWAKGQDTTHAAWLQRLEGGQLQLTSSSMSTVNEVGQQEE